MHKSENMDLAIFMLSLLRSMMTCHNVEIIIILYKQATILLEHYYNCRKQIRFFHVFNIFLVVWLCRFDKAKKKGLQDGYFLWLMIGYSCGMMLIIFFGMVYQHIVNVFDWQSEEELIRKKKNQSRSHWVYLLSSDIGNFTEHPA